jgi:hypothetical protein
VRWSKLAEALTCVALSAIAAGVANAQPASNVPLRFICTFDHPGREVNVLDVEVNQATNTGSVTVRNNGNRTVVDATLTPAMLVMRHVFSDKLTVQYTIDRVTLKFNQTMISTRVKMNLPGTCQLADVASRRF